MTKKRKPIDTEKMTKLYKREKGGICGQFCIAFIEGKTIMCEVS